LGSLHGTGQPKTYRLHSSAIQEEAQILSRDRWCCVSMHRRVEPASGISSPHCCQLPYCVTPINALQQFQRFCAPALRKWFAITSDIQAAIACIDAAGTLSPPASPAACCSMR
jgi:hypothetical protein